VGATVQETGFPVTLRVLELVELVRAHFPNPPASGELLERFGLADVAGWQAGGLSGGQKHRLAVALAFAGAWGARSRVSCCGLVLVDQPTEDVAATQPAQARRAPCFGSLRRYRRRVGQTAVRAALVVMLDVASQDASKLLVTHDQQLVQALPPDRADPALGDRVGVGRLHRCADNLGTGRAPHVVERLGELGVPVTDQELARGGLVAQDGGQVAGLLGDPGAVGLAVTPAR